MDGEQDGAKGAAEQKAGVAQPQEQKGREQKAQQVTPPAPAPTPEDDYKALLAKRDERIAELEASVAEAHAFDIFPDDASGSVNSNYLLSALMADKCVHDWVQVDHRMGFRTKDMKASCVV